jgi:lipopolysaccharide transport system permease protein
MWTLVRTDFKARYHGTLSGFAWALLKPLAMFTVLTAVFSLVFSTEGNYRLDLVVGLFLWDFFSEGTKTGLTALHAKGFLISKARFPSWILVLTSIANPLITITMFGFVLCVYLTLTGQAPTPASVALFAGYVVTCGVIIVGFSLGGSVLFLRYRDLNQVWDVVIQAGFFVAPIVYPLGVIPEQYHFALYAWPPTAVIEFSRAVLIDGQRPTAVAHTYLLAMALVSLAVGAAIFRVLAPRSAEYL